MNGSQALLRLMMLQRQIDERAGLNTGGFIPAIVARHSARLTRTRGKRKAPRKSHIKFVPGVNEELATAVWGNSS